MFSISEDITVPVFNGIAIFENIEVYEGTRLINNFTFSSNNPNQRFILQNSGIDTDLISVFVRNNEQSTISVKYNLQDSLFDINNESKVFFFQEIEDERYEIIFGDGIFGKKLRRRKFY